MKSKPIAKPPSFTKQDLNGVKLLKCKICFTELLTPTYGDLINHLKQHTRWEIITEYLDHPTPTSTEKRRVLKYFFSEFEIQCNGNKDMTYIPKD